MLTHPVADSPVLIDTEFTTIIRTEPQIIIYLLKLRYSFIPFLNDWNCSVYNMNIGVKAIDKYDFAMI